ncbi:hypothetical protein [Siansivirga zeaxanthinifaciens]|uniref:Uncharacterized protein n=1 Tax=Siansivirga zeaxanthinifaciens CC-SAMT-1 TaxID=1454006 RepID=A0A0C5VWH1_9FLAO|nr:hypothetical protein [Siansivirga zeaxanthinifaciens]AJR03471.1 hypothetical protein AW14_07350 [Siansivirga zeaxanthinifaciens CC-SAMT-1]
MKDLKSYNIKHSGFKVPDNYFETLEDQLFSEIKLKNTIDDAGFKIPENYLSNLENAIISKVKEEKTGKVITLFNRKKLIYISGVAAAVLLLFTLTFNSKSNNWNNLDFEMVENYMITEDILDSYEIASLLPEEDLIESNFIQIDFNEENIENYLLNNLDIEDLTTE